ncbi:MAG: hypothetical protein JWQ10_2671 [Herbaspirillum sp.]|nr:hypothetical protein [Herbaspirillum sp.]
MKHATALLRKGKILVQGYSQATTGMWIAQGPVYVIDENETSGLGIQVLAVLNASTIGVKQPSQDEWKKIQAPMLEAAGVKSWTTLAKGAKAVGIVCDEGGARMVPSSGYEHKGGKSLTEKTVRCELVSDQLGRSLVEAFNLCD